ncbi:hypothetical protein EG328_010654 [Venturia inaequalis]|uniref:Uncharacterized protein n=1 Tax=Venturia inaequalis TaxID=5025 RepID=A0A8H3U6E3_VENIN|nr:hypothetical protein EG328_010654 [Venturia inaequalis]KAE9970939.1 hypothetical protein EG327_010121 [Venturia inaequalis]RDI80630.1 hypothetical protein Vi05172_g9343 [Venturia inaequalis]
MPPTKPRKNRTTTEPATFLSLPHELRQNILLLSHELQLTIPFRNPRYCRAPVSPRSSIAAKKLQIHRIYTEHIIEGSRYMGMLRGIGEELKQVHTALEEDVEYIVGKWVEGVMKWLDAAEKEFREGDAELKRRPEELSRGN